MEFDPNFVEAFIHRPRHIVLGRCLRPLCLWHLLLLRIVQSPLLERAVPITPRDLDIATSICRCRYQQADLLPRGRVRLLLALGRSGGLKVQTTRFMEYMEDYVGSPNFLPVLSEAQRTAPPALPVGRPPSEFSKAATIIGWAHCKISQAWEMPIGEADWYCAAAREAGGQLLDFGAEEEEAKFLAAMEERDRKKSAVQPSN